MRHLLDRGILPFPAFIQSFLSFKLYVSLDTLQTAPSFTLALYRKQYCTPALFLLGDSRPEGTPLGPLLFVPCLCLALLWRLFGVQGTAADSTWPPPLFF